MSSQFVCYADNMMARKKSHDPHSWYANYFNHAVRLIVLVILIIIALEVYRYLLADIISGRSHFFAFLVLWLFSAYLVLPRLNRFFSKLYLPDYFIGRAATGDGLLGDPINLAVYGSKEVLIMAMQQAGWNLADPLTLKSSLRMTYAALRGASYPHAPVSALFLFNHKQSFAFEKDLHGNPRKRHHIRFWDTPEKWWLPGGYHVQWLGAATFDEHVGLSLFTGQVTHKIDSNVDKERDFVLRSLKDVHAVKSVTMVDHFTSSYHSRNGGGDMIHTDGALPFITLA
jgi:hypothetical protein